MPNYLSQDEAFNKCKKEGRIINLEELELDKIEATIEIAQSDLNSAKILKNNITKDSKEWNTVYKLHYDALHELVEAFLRFEKVKSDNHQCLYAYLCKNHPELDFGWDFFERVRTKRNGINYYGIPIKHEDWKQVELQINLCINKLKEEINKKIKSFKKSSQP